MTYIYPYPIRVRGYTLTVEQFAELYKRIKPDYTIVLDEDVFTGGTLGLALVNFGYKLSDAHIDAQSLGVFIDLPICRETLRVMLVTRIKADVNSKPGKCPQYEEGDSDRKIKEQIEALFGPLPTPQWCTTIARY